MRGSHFFNDGLWRCLCPGFNQLARRQAVSSSRRSARDGARRATPPQPTSIASLRLPDKRRFTTYHSGPESASTLGDTAQQSPSPKNGVPPYEPLLMPTPPTQETLHRASLDDMAAALLTMRDPNGWTCHGKEIDRYSRILLLVRHLLSERGQRPSPFIYECIMDAMVDPQGSARGIRKLFDDMASQYIKPTSDMCRSALAALSNHPDAVLRQEILDTMQQFWYTVDPGARQSVVLGLLRDEQYELAYLRLTELLDKKTLIDPWVYDIFIMVLGRLGYVDEMLVLLYRRKSLVREDRDIASILYSVLDVCSQAFHYAGTVMAWNCLVRTSLLQASDGITENVLATAARHGDTTLATEALDKLAQRTRLLPHHYEAVVEAFAADRDVPGALRTLCVMKKNGIRVDRADTRAVYKTLTRDPALLSDAETSLRELAVPDQQHHVPLAAASVVIEALAEKHGAEAAMALYKDVPRLCGERPDAAMMQTLIAHSRGAETTRSLAADYKAHVVAEGDDAVQSLDVHKALVVACAQADELDLAFRFAAQIVRQPGSMRAPPVAQHLAWVKALIGKAVEGQDARMWPVVDALRGMDGGEGGGEVARELGRVLTRVRMGKRAAERRGHV